MPRLRQAQTQFSQGEFSPLMVARADLKQYAGGAQRLLNWRPLSQGGVATRPALEHVANLPFAPAVLVPFVFRSDQRYVLSLSDGRLDAWTAAGTPCTGVAGCPWTAAQLDSLTWTVAGDTVLIFHPGFATQRITRTGATTFSVAAVAWEVPGLARLQDGAVTMAVSAVGGIGTAAVATFSAGFLTAGYVGRYLRWQGKNALVTGFVSSTQVNIQWTNDTTGLSTSATVDWLETAWAPEFGYPSCGAFHDGRLYVGATTSQPSAFWGSRAGAPFNFDLRTAQDGDGIAEAVGGLEAVPKIRHMVASDKMLVLADGGVWWIAGQSDKPVTPSTIGVRNASAVGAAAVRPAINDGAVLYIDATGRVGREARWSDTLQKFTDDPVTLVAEHLVKSPVQMTPVLGNDTQPGRLVVIANADGTMSVQHSIAAERVNAWVPWETAGVVESVAGVERDLFVAVVRNGTWRLERASETAAPLDGVLRVTAGAPTRVFTGWAHLAGMTVGVSYNGHDLGDAVVTGGGGITLADNLPEVPWLEAGLRFSQLARPLPIEADIGDGASRGLMKRLMRVFVRVIGRGDIKVKGQTKVLGFQGDDYTSPPDLFTGEVEVRTHGVSQDCVFDVEVPGAHRMTMLSLTREVQING